MHSFLIASLDKNDSSSYAQILLKERGVDPIDINFNAYSDITLEAQNALLKILEEPPNNTIIIITTPKKELLLPTIISRCKVIVLQEKEIKKHKKCKERKGKWGFMVKKNGCFC